MQKIKLKLFFYYFIIILYLEVIFKIFTFNKLFDLGLLYAFIFTIPLALFLAFLSNLSKPKFNKFLVFFFTIVLSILFSFHYIHHKLFSTIFSFLNIGLASQAWDFRAIVLSQIVNSWYHLILLLLPIILLIIFKKHLSFDKTLLKEKLLTLGIAFISFGLSLLLLLPTKSVLYSPYEMYFLTNDPTVSANTLGLLTTIRLDIKRVIFGFDNQNIYIEKNASIKTEEKTEYNMVDIDFDTLIANTTDDTLKEMHNYFKNETPTNKSEYTGIYEGKNLIFIIAEGFNEIAVKEDVTPTLYKLANEGIVFDNFYSPIFLSTTGGEYQAMNAAVVTDKGRNAWYPGDKYLPYALGNAFSNIGYTTYAFHDWSYTYYKRQKTMPELGFSNYLGCGNGMEDRMNCKQWPPSDISMMEVTIDDYLANDEPFVTYYFTVSGHTHYNWTGNSIAHKNKALVEDLDYSETAKAYLATQIELDKALELLIDKLEAAGKLDDTVIALVGDHHPYNMATGVSDVSDLTIINELSDREEEKDAIIEVNRSNFILWNSTTETVHISKVGSQTDVLPTLLNLFGMEYDSRLLIGKDLLSDGEGIAIFSDRSWVTDKGRYYASTKTFILKDNETVAEDYVDTINKKVSNEFTMSSLLMTKDYYKIVLGG